MRGRLLIRGRLLAGLAALGYFYTRPQPLSVQTVRVERGAVVETVVNTRAGTVKACRRARLAPPLGGQISQPFKKGDAVRSGQLLLELWNQDLQAQLSVAQRDVLAAASRAEEACVAADLARREANRLTTLLDRGLVAVDAADRARGDAEPCGGLSRCYSEHQRHSGAGVTGPSWAGAQPTAGAVRRHPAEINGEIGEFVTPSPLGVAATGGGRGRHQLHPRHSTHRRSRRPAHPRRHAGVVGKAECLRAGHGERHAVACNHQTGLRNSEYVEVSAGLQVVTSIDREGLREGAAAVAQ